MATYSTACSSKMGDVTLDLHFMLFLLLGCIKQFELGLQGLTA